MKIRLPGIHQLRWPRRQAAEVQAAPIAPAILRIPRMAALVVITILITGASLVSFAESYRGLYLWALHHGLSGIWAAAFPAQVDVFIAVGELTLFVALVDQWRTRQRAAAWLVTLAGLAVSVSGNIGHVTGNSLAVRATAAVPPLAASAALAVGLGVLKRVVERHRAQTEPDTIPSPIPTDAENAATIALRATVAAGNALSLNQLTERFSLTRAQATKIRSTVLAEANGHASGN